MIRSLLFPTLLDTFQAWNKLRIPKMGAALAYYTAFSLAPLLLLILSLASLLVRKDFARHALLSQVSEVMGERGAHAVKEILDHTSSPQVLSWETGISFIILMVSATGAFCELQDSLDQICEAPAHKHPIQHFFKGRALSFAMIFVLGFFMLVSLALSALLGGLSRYMVNPVPLAGWEIINFLISLMVIAGLFAVIFRVLPSVSLRWSEVWPGALVSSGLFALGKFLLGWYLGRGSFGSSYGATSSFLIVLVWVFYSAQILFLGAAFNRALTLRRQPRVRRET